MMFVDSLREACTRAGKGVNSKSDPTFMGIIFMAFICAVLPLDISQLTFALLGAVLYALLQKSDPNAPKKKPVSMVVDAAPRSRPLSRLVSPSMLKPSPPTAASEVRAPSVQPIVAPTFHSDGWEGEIQELLLQITPTTEAERIVNQLARVIQQTMQSVIPEIEVHGFANGNLTFGRAFGVAVPEVDIVANISPQVLFNRLHGRSSHSTPAQLDEKKLQKSAIRACTDRLVASGGFKFRRSAFRGSEPKVTLLAPASLGLFAESIAIDFSVNVVTPLYNAALLTECGKMDARAKELILLVRRWAKDRGICHAVKGHLSPYMWGLLTIYFLQVGESEESPLLPPLEQFELAAELIQGKRRTGTAQTKWKSQQTTGEKKSPAVLFKEFVHFYESQFDWHNEAVSICASRRSPPSLELPIHIIAGEGSKTSEVGPSIEDPFNKSQNLGDHMTAASLGRLKEELARAEALCLRAASLTELLEPWVPADAAELQNDAAELVGSRKEAAAAAPAKGENWRQDAKQAQSSAAPPWRRAGAAPCTRV